MIRHKKQQHQPAARTATFYFKKKQQRIDPGSAEAAEL
jgi:hypothetical protein